MLIEQNIPLAPLTTLRLGGSARFFAKAATESDLLEGIAFARQRELPLFILGGGSNLIVPDEGFPGLVLQAALNSPARITEESEGFRTYLVPAGMDWDTFVRVTCEAGVSGIECLAGIPGMVGGSPVQNIGAYGEEVSQTISEVHVLDLQTLSFRILPASECGFGYRSSIFNTSLHGRFIVTQVAFRFALDGVPRLSYADLKQYFNGRANPTPIEVYRAVREIRAGKGMLIDVGDPSPDARSAGSFFKNPVVPMERLERIAGVLNLPSEKVPNWPTGGGETKLAAAWLVEQGGFPKGFVLGPAGISSRHTLALINRSGSATCADLLRLRDEITSQVYRRFQISLEQEPVVLA